MAIRIPLAKTDIGPDEIASVSQVMVGGRLAFGPEIERFEKTFAEYHGVPDAVMVNSGTSCNDRDSFGPMPGVVERMVLTMNSCHLLIYLSRMQLFFLPE